MGFFDAKVKCSVCGQEAGLNRYRIADKGWVCPGCFKEAGLTMLDPVRTLTVEDIRNRMSKKQANQNELDNFNPTKKIGNLVEFDDNQKKWVILSGMMGKRNKSTVYNYGDILNFELLEDGESVSQGGLGRALVGGVLFGGTGAIVGGVTGKRKNKSICNSLKMKITLRDMNNPVVYINFLTTATKRDSFTFKTIYQLAQECLSVLQLICDTESKSQPTPVAAPQHSSADELMKFKNLLDAGVISQDEFNQKKKELLGF